MPNEAMLQVRIDQKTKTGAAKYFKRLGLSTSDGIRLLINQELREKDLERRPNAESRKAIAEYLANGGEKTTLDHLRKQWNEA